jgi:hypothetical protein
MEKDFHFNVMMETMSMVTDAVQIAKHKLDSLVMEEVQTVRIHAQNINHKKLNFFKQDKLIYMEKLYLMLCLITYQQI